MRQGMMTQAEFDKALVDRPKMFILDTCAGAWAASPNVFCGESRKLVVKYELFDEMIRRIMFDLMHNTFIANEILSGKVGRRNHFYSKYERQNELRISGENLEKITEAINEIIKTRTDDPMVELLLNTYII
jgi:hypothetical protein